MTAHDRHLLILFVLVLTGLGMAAFKIATPEAHDVLLIAIGSLTTEIATKEGEK